MVSPSRMAVIFFLLLVARIVPFMKWNFIEFPPLFPHVACACELLRFVFDTLHYSLRYEKILLERRISRFLFDFIARIP